MAFAAGALLLLAHAAAIAGLASISWTSSLLLALGIAVLGKAILIWRMVRRHRREVTAADPARPRDSSSP